ncbi:MAG: (2Fe-2S)-binding protein, partial [Candidatus Binatia bacterium]
GIKPQSRYRGSRIYARLKVAGVDVASMGNLGPALERDETFQIVEEQRNAYRKLVVRDGRLVGAMLVGNTAAAAALIQLFDRGDPLPGDPLEVLCRDAGPKLTGPRVICTCHQVTDETVRAAVAGGADSVAALGCATKAGTGCGSCQTDLEQLLASCKKPAPALEVAS